jgi:enamine deaminase RidA (YjgF/YER057c/UK114 family)
MRLPRVALLSRMSCGRGSTFRDIERNYRSVNQARNRYFDEQQIVRLPASTCVGGAVPGATVPVAMDLYAIAGNQEVRVESLSPEPMGEATTYGSAFARGSLITEPGCKTLLISGTASIDAKGGVVAVGDSKGQLDCMFGNVRGLLSQGWDGLRRRRQRHRVSQTGGFLS